MRLSRWLALLSIGLCGCTAQITEDAGNKQVEASGPIKTDVRAVGTFNRVRLEGSAGVEVKIGPKPSVSVTAEENIVPLITTEVKDDVLIIRTTRGYSSVRPAKVEIEMASLDGIECPGAGAIMVTGLKAKDFIASLKGTGQLKAMGTADKVTAELSGSGQIAFKDLHSKKVKVEMNGTGQASVFASQSLEAKLSGAGEISYYGNPAKVEKEATGVGAITAH